MLKENIASKRRFHTYEEIINGACEIRNFILHEEAVALQWYV